MLYKNVDEHFTHIVAFVVHLFIPSRVTTANQLSLICTFSLAENFRPDALPDTHFLWAGDRDKEARQWFSIVAKKSQQK